ncbi:MAG: hypothetical protein ABIZ56_11130, partial [Chthoniobacteraceae bacterium]
CAQRPQCPSQVTSRVTWGRTTGSSSMNCSIGVSAAKAPAQCGQQGSATSLTSSTCSSQRY